MKRNLPLFLIAALAVGTLFWSSQAALGFLALGVIYFLMSRRIPQFVWGKITGRKMAGPDLEQERTLITMVLRAPYQLLGIDPDAGTGTIFGAFYSKIQGEQEEGLRLSRQGRRVTAAKNAMMQNRRQKGRPSTQEKARKARISLNNLLADRPVCEGKVVQFANLSPEMMENFREGREVADLGLTAQCGEEEKLSGRGNCRLVIMSQSGRYLTNAEEGQVAFLPGTRFLVVSRKPWRNPDYPELPAGFTIELEELALAA